MAGAKFKVHPAVRDLLPVLEGIYAEYWVTDISPSLLSSAEDKFRDYDFLLYRRLDLEQPPELQEVPTGAFDVVIAADVLHATADLGSTLEHVRDYICFAAAA